MSSNTLRALMLGASLTAIAGPALAGQADATTVDTLIISAAARQTPATQETTTADEIKTTVNAMNVEDTVKYIPSLIVRKRHIGDTQAPLATRTSGLGASARTLIYADGVLLSALIGNNNSTASPRWGMVAPEEISSVDFLYGPFSAAYAGNSIGGVLNIKTRTPTKREGSLHIAGSWQDFQQYATDDTFRAGQISGSYGDRIGDLWFRFSANQVTSNSQPLGYATVARPSSTSASGTVVTGPFADVNRLNAPIAVFGATGLEHQVQTNLKLRAGYELPFASLIYTAGQFLNDTDSHVETYARDGAGQPFYSGTANFDGRAYSVGASTFSNGVYAMDENHLAQSLSLISKGSGPWGWSLAGSAYDYNKSRQAVPTAALPAALTGGAGNITDMKGTGWQTLDGTVSYAMNSQKLSAGAHQDEVDLASTRYATANWVDGVKGAKNLQSLGQTRTSAVWAQDAIDLSGSVRITLGGRYEDWQASHGYNFSTTPTSTTSTTSVHQPERSASAFSPKASLTWAGMNGWTISGSYGEAYRFPTVTELYQAITTGSVLTVPNPTLRPEHARSSELAVERDFNMGHVRASLFDEQVSDALISQSTLVPGSSSVASFVQNIDRTHVRGLELAAETHDLGVKGLDLSASWTWTDPQVAKDAALPAAVGKQVPGIPKDKATIVATYRPDDKWAFSLAGRYSSRLFATIDNTDTVTHTYQGFDPFLVADVRATYRLDAHWEAAVGVDNLFDDRYFLFHPFPGRTLQAELNYKF